MAELRNPEAAEETPTSMTRHTASNSFSRGGILFTYTLIFLSLSFIKTLKFKAQSPIDHKLCILFAFSSNELPPELVSGRVSTRLQGFLQEGEKHFGIKDSKSNNPAIESIFL